MPSTFAALLAEQTRAAHDPGRPFVTWYGVAAGERVELSVTSYANWVAKTASLLQDELDVQRGDRVLLDLPSHWLGPVCLGACWALGAVAVAPGGRDLALVVSGPAGLPSYAEGGVPVVATSLAPLGTRFTEPLPPGVVDLGEVVWGQPDAFTAWDPPEPADPAWDDPDGTLTQADLLARTGSGQRTVSAEEPVGRTGIALLVAALASGGGTVWVPPGQPGRVAEVAQAEKAVPA